MRPELVKEIADLVTALCLVGFFGASIYFQHRAFTFKNKFLASEREKENLKIKNEVQNADLDELIDTANNRPRRRDS